MRLDTFQQRSWGKGPSYLLKGLRLKARIKASNCVVYREVSDVVVEGNGQVEAVSFKSGSKTMRLEARCVALHEGVIPAQQVTRALGCAHEWDPVQHAFRPEHDHWGASSVDDILIAGDCGGIGGARAAEHGGRLAAVDVLRRLGRIHIAERDTQSRDDRVAMKSHLMVRPFLDRLFAPRVAAPIGQTIVCRCEEITADAINDLAVAGLGPNQVKSFLRCGMGPCQGRMCGPVVSDIIAQARGVSPAEVGYYHVRTPLKPLTLGELSALAED